MPGLTGLSGLSGLSGEMGPMPWWTGWDYAYQARGAASLAASYTNLVTPGTSDLPGTGVLPTWSSLMGWKFNGTTQYLNTGITPAANWSAIVQYANAGQVVKIAFGSQTTGATRFYVFPYQSATKLQYSNGGFVTVAPPLLAGNLGMGGQQGYRNGIPDGAAMSAWSGVGLKSILGR